MAEMDWAEVLDVVIGQIGEIRVPMREKEIRDALDVALHNLGVLRESMEKARDANKDTEGGQNGEENPAGAEVRDCV